MPILFYKINEPYGCFSNFAHYEFVLDNKTWKTSEHYFQAQKFKNTEYEELIRLAETPMDAAKIGRNKQLPLRNDWENVKDDIMRKAVLAKFSQNSNIKDILISTNNDILIEQTSNDYYWGCGTNGTGKIC